MPYTTGKLKGQLTSTELRRLVKEHNKLYTIKIPKGTSYEGLIQLIKDNGYAVDHKNQKLRLLMKNLPKTIDLPAPPVKKTKEEIAKVKKEKEGNKNVKDTEAYKKRKDQVDKLKKLKEVRDRSKIKMEKYITKPFKMKSMIDNILKDKDRFMDTPDKNKLNVILDPSKNGWFQIKMEIDKKENTQDTIFLRFSYKKWKDMKQKATDNVSVTLKIKKNISLPLKDLKDSVVLVVSGGGSHMTIPSQTTITKQNQTKSSKIVNQAFKEVYNIKVVFTSAIASEVATIEKKYHEKGTPMYHLRGDKMELIKYKPVFKLKKTDPTPVKIDDKKKPPSNIMKIDDTNKWKLIPVKTIDATNPLTKKDYVDIRDIPAEEIFKNIEANKEASFYPWTSYFASAIFTYTYILKENDNDCSLPMSIMKKIQNEKNTTNQKITNPNANLKKYAEEIAENIIRCWGKDKVICIPISIVQGGKKHTHSYHANMLIFNTYRMEAEHFEPHGEHFYGNGKYDSNGVYQYSKVQGINFKPAITEINKEIKKLLKSPDKIKGMITNEKTKQLNKGFVYKTPLDICPPKSEWEGFQGFQTLDRYRENKTRDFNGVVITEIGGYCAMWSLFYLATRLKTLKAPTTEITGKLNKMFADKYKKTKKTIINPNKKSGLDPSFITERTDNRKDYIELMRGMSKFSYEKNLEMVKKGLLTKEELIKYMGHTDDDWDYTLYLKYGKAVESFTQGEWATFTS